MKTIIEYINEALDDKKVKIICDRLFKEFNADTKKVLNNATASIINGRKKEFNLSDGVDRKAFFKAFGDKSVLSKYDINDADVLANLASPIRGNIENYMNGDGVGKGIRIIDKIAEQIRKRELDFETKRTEAVNKIESMFNVEEGTNQVDDLKKFDKDNKDIIVCRSILYPEIPCLFFIQKEEDLEENGKYNLQEIHDDIDYYYLDFLYNRYSKKELRYMFAETKYGFGYASRWYPCTCLYKNFVKNPNPTEDEFNNK